MSGLLLRQHEVSIEERGMSKVKYETVEISENGKDTIELTVCSDGAIQIRWKDTGHEFNLTVDELDSVYFEAERLFREISEP